MKKRKKKTFSYLFILFCVIGSVSVTAQETQGEKPLDKIKLAEQIPEESLSSMSTEQLIQSYLNSRYPGYLLIYNDINNAFDHAYRDYNGLRELLKRADAAQELIRFYQKMDPVAYNSDWEPVKKGAFSFSFVFVETLLAHQSIHKKLTKSQVKTLLTELLKKYELKRHHPELYSTFGIQYTAYSIAQLLESKGKDSGITNTFLQSPGIIYLLKTGKLQNNDLLPIIIQKAKEFLNTY